MAQTSRSVDDRNPVWTLRAQRKSDGGGISYSSRQMLSIMAPLWPSSIQLTQRRNIGSSNDCSGDSAALALERPRMMKSVDNIRRRIGHSPRFVKTNWRQSRSDCQDGAPSRQLSAPPLFAVGSESRRSCSEL